MELPRTYWISSLVCMCVCVCVCVCVDIIAASFAHCRILFRRSSTTFCLSKDSGNFHSTVGVAPRRKRTVNFVLSVLTSCFVISPVFSTTCTWRLGSSQPPVRWEPGLVPREVKRPWYLFYHWPSCSAEVKNGWCYTYTPPACLSGVDRGFAFPL